MKQSVLFVCLGNICRSPTAEGILRHYVADRGLTDKIDIDSAGTGAWHQGEPPDQRMTAAAKRKGFILSGKARKVTSKDFQKFDFILAMDQSNLDSLESFQPESSRAKLHLFRAFDPVPDGLDTPDPYYGGQAGFDEVVQIVDRTCQALLDYLEKPFNASR